MCVDWLVDWLVLYAAFCGNMQVSKFTERTICDIFLQFVKLLYYESTQTGLSRDYQSVSLRLWKITTWLCPDCNSRFNNDRIMTSSSLPWGGVAGWRARGVVIPSAAKFIADDESDKCISDSLVRIRQNMPRIYSLRCRCHCQASGSSDNVKPRLQRRHFWPSVFALTLKRFVAWRLLMGPACMRFSSTVIY